VISAAQKHAESLAAEEAWRQKYNKEERKKRYVQRGVAEKRAAKRQRMSAED
jgi:ribosome biogenesis protein BMS1